MTETSATEKPLGTRAAWRSRESYAVARRLMRNGGAIIGAVVLIMMIIVAVGAPFFAPHDPTVQNLRENLQPPSATYWFGTDNLGRDIFSRVIYGARVSLLVGVSSVAIGLIFGLPLGLIAGYRGGWTDTVIMRVIDVLLAFPGLLLAIAIIAVLGTGITNTIIAVGVFAIPTFARIMRASVLSLKEQEFVVSSRAIGANDGRIILRHVLPNAWSPMIVETTMLMGTAILTASGLSFLGLGVQPPSPEWGAMLSQARTYLRSAPHVSIPPGVAITVLVLSLSLLGDGLRDALDPRLKE